MATRYLTDWINLCIHK